MRRRSLSLTAHCAAEQPLTAHFLPHGNVLFRQWDDASVRLLMLVIEMICCMQSIIQRNHPHGHYQFNRYQINALWQQWLDRCFVWLVGAPLHSGRAGGWPDVAASL